MSIKISDIIWTIICFGLFTLVVNLLLLKPMLRFMDARKERLEKARARKAELDAGKAALAGAKNEQRKSASFSKAARSGSGPPPKKQSRS